MLIDAVEGMSSQNLESVGLRGIEKMNQGQLAALLASVTSNTNWTSVQCLMGSGGNTKYSEKRYVPDEA
jgi:hypothetical protein